MQVRQRMKELSAKPTEYAFSARLKTQQRKDVPQAHAKYQAPECLLSENRRQCDDLFN